MKKKIGFSLAGALIFFLIYSAVCVLTLPDAVCLMAGERPEFSQLAQSVLNVQAEPVTGVGRYGGGDGAVMTLKALGIPVKSFSVDIFQDVEVVPWGRTVGVRIDTDGVLVLGTGAVPDGRGAERSPSEGVLKPGDLIVSADGAQLGKKEDLQNAVKSSGGTMALVVMRDGRRSEMSVSPAEGADGQKSIGVWVRDSTQGIGTVTYYNPETGGFAALGHGIMDIDTKKLMAIKDGELWQSDIYDIKKGKKGAPGELVGKMDPARVLGRVKDNSPTGIFGTIENAGGIPGGSMKISLQNRVHEGPASIRSNISGSEIKEYDVYIESVNRHSQDSSRGMVVRITDPGLLQKTGGIVQGMSGSPIIQENRLIGAVTHVFVQDPAKGYGIFIENMLRQERAR